MKKIIILLTFSFVILLVSFRQRTLTWVAIGDSITYLNDHPNETGNRLTKGYMTQVVEQLPNIHFVNQGHNGWTVTRIAQNFDKLGVPANADVYSVFLGTNDWWHSNRLGTMEDYLNHTSDTTIFGAYRVIIDKIRQLNKNASIILITPMQRGDFVQINNPKNNAYGSYKEKDGQTLEQVVDAVRAIGRHEHLPVIDLYHEKALSVPYLVHFKRLKDPQTGAYSNVTYPDYTKLLFDAAQSEYAYPVEAMDMTYDGLHPSDKGDSIIARRLIKILKKL